MMNVIQKQNQEEYPEILYTNDLKRLSEYIISIA